MFNESSNRFIKHFLFVQNCTISTKLLPLQGMLKLKRYISSLLLALFIIAMGCRFVSVISCECNESAQKHTCCSCSTHIEGCSTHSSQFDSLCLLQIVDNSDVILAEKATSLRRVDSAKQVVTLFIQCNTDSRQELRSFTTLAYSSAERIYKPQNYITSRSLRAPPALA